MFIFYCHLQFSKQFLKMPASGEQYENGTAITLQPITTQQHEKQLGKTYFI